MIQKTITGIALSLLLTASYAQQPRPAAVKDIPGPAKQYRCRSSQQANGTYSVELLKNEVVITRLTEVPGKPKSSGFATEAQAQAMGKQLLRKLEQVSQLPRTGNQPQPSKTR